MSLSPRRTHHSHKRTRNQESRQRWLIEDNLHDYISHKNTVVYTCYIVYLLLFIRMLRLVECNSRPDNQYCLKEVFVIKAPENTNSAVRFLSLCMIWGYILQLIFYKVPELPLNRYLNSIGNNLPILRFTPI